MNIKTFGRSLIGFACCFHSHICFAFENGEIRISQAFKNDFGIIAQVCVYLDGKCQDTVSNYPVGFFWTTGDDSFYELHRINDDFGLGANRLARTISISVPTKDNAQHTAEVSLNIDNHTAVTGEMVKFTEAHVYYAGKSDGFRAISDKELAELNKKLGTDSLAFHLLPDARFIDKIFRYSMSDADGYFIFEKKTFANFSSQDENVEIIRSMKGEIDFVSYELTKTAEFDVFKISDTENIQISRLDGRAFLESVGDPTIELEPITMDDPYFDYMDAFGLADARYRAPILRTPCELIWN